MAGKLKALQQWCKLRCEGYRDVDITNMTSSWKSGLAFCAIIHRYRPDLIDYDSLSKENTYENSKLAFDVALSLGIPALLDPEDMVTMTVPDKLCIITYVAQYYNYFHNKPQEGGPGVRKATSKRPFVTDPSSSNGNRSEINPSEPKKPSLLEINRQTDDVPVPAKRSTMDDRCYICRGKVYLLERHYTDGHLCHRKCQRDSEKPSSAHGDRPGSREDLTSHSSSAMNVQKADSPHTMRKTEDKTPNKASTGGKVAETVSQNNNSASKSTSAITRLNTAFHSAPSGFTVAVAGSAQVQMAPSSTGNTRVPDGISVSTSGFHSSINTTRSRPTIIGSPAAPTQKSSQISVSSSSANNSQTKTTFGNSTNPSANTFVTSSVVTTTFGLKSHTTLITTQSLVTPATRYSENRAVSGNMGLTSAVTDVGNKSGFIAITATTSGDHIPFSTTTPKAVSRPTVISVVKVSSNNTISTSGVSSSANNITSSSNNTFKTLVCSATTAPIMSPDVVSKSTVPPSINTRTTELSVTQPTAMPRYAKAPLKTSDVTVAATCTVLSDASTKIAPATTTSHCALTFKDTSPVFSTTMVTAISTVTRTTPVVTMRPKDDTSMQKSLLENLSAAANRKQQSAASDSNQTQTSTLVVAIPQKPPRVTHPASAGKGITIKNEGFPTNSTSITLTIFTPETGESVNNIKAAGNLPVVRNKVEEKVNDEAIDKRPTWQIDAEKQKLARSRQNIDPDKLERVPVSPKTVAPSVAPPRPPPPTSPPIRSPTPSAASSSSPKDGKAIDLPSANIGPNPNRLPTSEPTPAAGHTVIKINGDRIYHGSTESLESTVSKSGQKRQTKQGGSNQPQKQASGSEEGLDKTHGGNKKKKIISAPKFVFDDEPENRGTTTPIIPGMVFTGKDSTMLPNFDDTTSEVRQWLDSNQSRIGGNRNVPMRQINAEEPMALTQITARLEYLDENLRNLEHDGRVLEEQIRSRTDEAMDDEQDDLMVKWFQLVKQRYELVRDESLLIYKRRQQELEDLHSQLEYQYRCLSHKQEYLKTEADKQLEESLLKRLLETVSQRNSIVDSMEQDRLRYEEEDKNIDLLLESTGVGNPATSKVKKEKEVKKKTKKDDGDAKPKKTLMRIFSMKVTKSSDLESSSKTTWMTLT